jgi:hypothetical protein
MFVELAYFQILGRPLIFYLGIITYVSFLSTATIAYLTKGRIVRIHFKWHTRAAVLSLALATFHGFLGVAAYF